MICEKLIDVTRETAVNLVQTEIESIKRTNVSKTSFRTYSHGYIGVAGAVGPHNELELERVAKEALKHKIIYPCEPSKQCKEKRISLSEINNEDQFITEIEILTDSLRSKHSDYSLSNKISIINRETYIQNDCGLDLYNRVNYFSVKLLFKQKGSKNIFDGKIFISDREFVRQKLCQSCEAVFSAYTNIIDLPYTNDYIIMFNILDFFPLRKLTEDLNGYKFGSGNSPLSNKRWEKVFNEDFTLYQNLNLPDTFEPFFDAEGVLNESGGFNFIDHGIIVSPYTDKKTASMFKLPLTGSAVAEYDGIPKPGLTQFKLNLCNKTLKDLLGGQKAILVMDMSRGGVTIEGDINFPVQLAMLFDGETLIGRLPPFNISANYHSLFNENFIGATRGDIFSNWGEDYLLMNFGASSIDCIE